MLTSVYLWWLCVATIVLGGLGWLCPYLISLPNTLANIIGLVIMVVAIPLSLRQIILHKIFKKEKR